MPRIDGCASGAIHGGFEDVTQGMEVCTPAPCVGDVDVLALVDPAAAFLLSNQIIDMPSRLPIPVISPILGMAARAM